jgi:hypothetical protein
MTSGGDVGITSGPARVFDPNRARREAAEQKLVMRVSAEPEQLLIDPANPFASGPFARFSQGEIGLMSQPASARFCATACAGAAMR